MRIVLALLLTILPLLSLSAPAIAQNDTPPLIMIDAGHGGIDGGTQSKDGSILEKDLNLQIAKKLAKQLREAGFRVAMTRETDQDVTQYAPIDRGWGRHKRDLYGRVEAARQTGATLFVSLHGNHGRAPHRGGIVYYQPDSFESYMLASELQTRLNRLSKKKYIPRQGKSFFILRRSDIPSVLVEYGYLSNDEELANLLDESYQNRLVQSLCDGIGQFVMLYHVTKK
ncbi:N-acetylmuramoyl-L-alanine amidase family protein [Effusibacillus pohliae]|uniref:N-acetylmuramoyl-L-alanine amidase family protein n=1 Tax=Effusibacillus pohliae TaxID=232270 RepID=UPI000376443B|nr:N-acetylmuramoyl-L-alanine amidase [Effusibacillus pohliae]